MKATLYDALGILPTSSDEEVRAALRGLIRKYYAKTRDGQGNVEEALRFINHASRILSDGERRGRYDAELARSADDDDRPTLQEVENALLGDDAHTEVGPASGQGGDADDDIVTDVPGESGDVPATHHPGLTERVASFTRSPLVTYGVCALFAAFIATAIVVVTPPDFVVVARSVLGSFVALGVLLGAIYGIVHGAAVLRRRRASNRSALVPQTDLAILNWRRERSVFLGTNQPQEDASWIFQLRMAELERAKSGRTSEPRPWHRLAARGFDYAIFGLLLALLLSQLRAAGVVPADTAYWLSHPLLAPVIVTMLFVPVEALLVTAVGTTPGKWLFGVYLQFSISDAYARRDTRTQLLRALRRSLRVWAAGVGCGFPLLAPILAAIAHERLTTRQETDWDFAEDCLVTHGPAGVVNTVTGVCGLAAMAWLYGVAWEQPLSQTLAAVRARAVSSVPSGADVRAALTRASDRVQLVPAVSVPSASDLMRLPGALVAKSSPGAAVAPAALDDGPSEADFERTMAARRARIDALQREAPRVLSAGNPRRAAELCRAWVELDLGNAEAWRCLGRAELAAGQHHEALAAFRKAREHAPSDRSIDADIDRAQRGIVDDFLARYRR
jgi:hypothetical protein